MKSKQTLTSDQHKESKKPYWIVFFLTFFAVSVLLSILPHNREVKKHRYLDDNQIKEVVADLSFQKGEYPDKLSRDEFKKANLGQLVFYDFRFSKNEEFACSNCHNPARSFTDGKVRSTAMGVTERNSPTLLNTFSGFWFYWDGRKDSLASQALNPIEHPHEQAMSRTAVAKLIKKYFKKDYENAFGSLPKEITDDLPDAAPLPIKPKLTIDVSAYALSTVGNYDKLESILISANRKRIAPANELAERSAALPTYPKVWQENWLSLDEKTRQAVNLVFANVGRALEAYQKGLLAVDSAFDRYALRILEKRMSPLDAINENFTEKEFLGLQIFAGPGKCTFCHNGPNFTDQQFHNIGLGPSQSEKIDLGRAQGILEVIQDPFNCRGPHLTVKNESTMLESCRELPYLNTKNQELVGAFKTPTLRNIALTAPYTHDGRFADLQEMLEHYNFLDARPAVGHREETLKPLDLKEEELAALEAFLKSLTSEVRDLTAEVFNNPGNK